MTVSKPINNASQTFGDRAPQPSEKLTQNVNDAMMPLSDLSSVRRWKFLPTAPMCPL